MKILFFIPFVIISYTGSAQKKQPKENLDVWKKAVVNVETEGDVYPIHIIDSLIKSKKDLGYDNHELDSIGKLYLITVSETGTAIYIRYGDRKYLITAKHVLSNQVFISQKTFENINKINKWDTLEAIYPRISVRTPFEYFISNKAVNNLAVITNSFVKGPKPYFFISDSTGDGIGVISLQPKVCKILDTILQKNGYSPISLEEIVGSDDIKELDEIYTIGFPEIVSVVGRINFPANTPFTQSTDLVTPFIVKGTVSMFAQNIQHYYVDLTIYPGDSGSPIIKNGKLVGIISGLNKYRILGDNNKPSNQTLFGIGHLVSIIRIDSLKKELDNFKKEEDDFLSTQ